MEPCPDDTWEVGRWGGGEVGRWGGGEVGRWGPLDTTAPLVELVRVTVFFNAPAKNDDGGETPCHRITKMACHSMGAVGSGMSFDGSGGKWHVIRWERWERWERWQKASGGSGG